MEMKKLPSQHKTKVFALVMSFNTALMVSGVITFINAPSTNIFLQKWLFNFLLGWPLVFLSIILIGPPVTRFVNLIVE
jgi:hypothetical protein